MKPQDKTGNTDVRAICVEKEKWRGNKCDHTVTTGSPDEEREEVRLGPPSWTSEMQSFPCGFSDAFSHSSSKYLNQFPWKTGKLEEQVDSGRNLWELVGSGVIWHWFLSRKGQHFSIKMTSQNYLWICSRINIPDPTILTESQLGR